MKTHILTKLILLVLVTAMALSVFTGCESWKLDRIMKNLGEEDMTCGKYDLDKYTKYYWDSDVIYNESVMPLQEKDGSMAPIGLMYKISKILEVRSADLKTVYKEGTDYVLEEGKLVIPKGSSIETIPYTDYYPTAQSTCEKIDGIESDTYVLWGKCLQDWQIAVTYVHTDDWEANVPPAQGNTLTKTLKKLENKEPLKILIYGDSISEGCESTSQLEREPYTPGWYDMLADKLKEIYGYDDIEIINTAVGGTDSAWGVQNATERGADYAPDLAIVSFGMNDGYQDPAIFAENVLQICTRISFGNEDCEFIVTATMLPNPNARGFCGTQDMFAKALHEKDFSFAGTTVVADMSAYYSDILANKRYFDINSNNINHPNDFTVRAYAQLMLRTLEKE